VAASDLYIKSISGASVNVKVGVLPTAAPTVTSVVAAASVEQLSTGLNMEVESITVPSPPPPPPPSSSDSTAVIAAVIGGLVGVGIIIALIWFCSTRDAERRVSLVKMDEALQEGKGSRLSLTYQEGRSPGAIGGAYSAGKSKAMPLAHADLQYTAQV